MKPYDVENKSIEALDNDPAQRYTQIMMIVAASMRVSKRSKITVSAGDKIDNGRNKALAQNVAHILET